MTQHYPLLISLSAPSRVNNIAPCSTHPHNSPIRGVFPAPPSIGQSHRILRSVLSFLCGGFRSTCEIVAERSQEMVWSAPARYSPARGWEGNLMISKKMASLKESGGPPKADCTRRAAVPPFDMDLNWVMYCSGQLSKVPILGFSGTLKAYVPTATPTVTARNILSLEFDVLEPSVLSPRTKPVYVCVSKVRSTMCEKLLRRSGVSSSSEGFRASRPSLEVVKTSAEAFDSKISAGDFGELLGRLGEGFLRIGLLAHRLRTSVAGIRKYGTKGGALGQLGSASKGQQAPLAHSSHSESL
ncbi:hypothetical protein CROQUDRAFT_97715 [Cronartium quercuum f. sp. fusiforme G11]|uniref:Uncharacterized protein n=1 Tax=Cronartium quercuum f. sp. fusiforme G11 TaxID=708437 RepID=A0A9P6N9X3_9BASI|nr:hypothetical protein CROQUDRAFT_97715 [Cronartium quercuum f. sp. fusiforme G11]